MAVTPEFHPSPSIVDDIPDAVIIVDCGGVVRFANRACEVVFGFAPEVLVGADVSTLIPEDVRHLHDQHVADFSAEPRARSMGAGAELRARRRDGSTVPVDVALVPVRDRPGFVAAFVRDVSVRQSLIDLLRARDELVTALLQGAPRPQWLEGGVRRAREFLRADAGWLSLVDADRTTLEVVAADGDDARTVVGARIPAAASHVSGERRPAWVVVDDVRMSGNPFPQLLSMDLGPLVVLPIRRSGGAFAGALALGRRRGSSTFTEGELTRCAQFVQVISVALELSEAQAALGQLAILDEHDRIARDLHDTVIQDLFAIGLRLEAVVSRSPPGEMAEQTHDAVAALDDVISGIRTVIFDLQSPAMAQGGLRQTVLDVTHEARSVLGFRPRVRFVGQVDATVNATQAQSLVRVLREALSNVVRHADATEVDIVVDVTDELSLIVLDDGRGLSDGPTAGSGLVNLGARAKALGGSFSIEPRARGGTIVRWRVPIETSNDRQPTAGAV